MIGLGGREKHFFSRKKVFPFPQTPILFQKKRSVCRSACPAIARRATADCRGRTFINSSHPYSRKRALHVCRRQTLHIATQCFTTDAIRLFTSLHPPLFEKSEVFCRSACPAIARRATADCRGITYINLSYPYSRKRALHVCRRQTLHIAKQCFTTDAIRLFTSLPPSFFKKSGVCFAPDLSRHSSLSDGGWSQNG